MTSRRPSEPEKMPYRDRVLAIIRKEIDFAEKHLRPNDVEWMKGLWSLVLTEPDDRRPVPDAEMVEGAADSVAMLRNALNEKRICGIAEERPADLYRAIARVLEAYDALQVQPQGGWRPPEGWKLVPVEPTPEMTQAGVNAGYAGLDGYGAATRGKYRAMLAAAPLPPAPTQNEKE